MSSPVPAGTLLGAVRGPIVLITLGILFALDVTFDAFHFRHTWPVLIIVIGVLKLAESMGSRAGQAGSGWQAGGQQQ
ncbi:MAG: hypothetical protein FJW40_21300 [Acidobacteria bacterium]|nr:hypothetical protein [Acidobacteriota bacterium]